MGVQGWIEDLGTLDSARVQVSTCWVVAALPGTIGITTIQPIFIIFSLKGDVSARFIYTQNDF